MRWSEIEASELSWILVIGIFIAVSGTGGAIGMFCKVWGFATLIGAFVGAIVAATGLLLFSVDLADNTTWIAVAAGCGAYSAFGESKK